MVDNAMDEIDAAAVNSILLGATPDGEPVVVRVGKYGPYLQIGEANGPSVAARDRRPTNSRSSAPSSCSTRRRATANSASTPRPGLPVLAKNGKYGPVRAAR